MAKSGGTQGATHCLSRTGAVGVVLSCDWWRAMLRAPGLDFGSASMSFSFVGLVLEREVALIARVSSLPVNPEAITRVGALTRDGCNAGFLQIARWKWYIPSYRAPLP